RRPAGRRAGARARAARRAVLRARRADGAPALSREPGRAGADLPRRCVGRRPLRGVLRRSRARQRVRRARRRRRAGRALRGGPGAPRGRRPADAPRRPAPPRRAAPRPAALRRGGRRLRPAGHARRNDGRYPKRADVSFRRPLLTAVMLQETAVDYATLERQLRSLIADEPDPLANTANFVGLLYNALPEVNWLGVYVLRGEELVLGPFQGKPACVRLPLGRGVCGSAAAARRTLRVPDVREF